MLAGRKGMLLQGLADRINGLSRPRQRSERRSASSALPRRKPRLVALLRPGLSGDLEGEWSPWISAPDRRRRAGLGARPAPGHAPEHVRQVRRNGWTGNIAPSLAKGGKLGGAKSDGELVGLSRHCIGLFRPMFLPTSSFITL